MKIFCTKYGREVTNCECTYCEKYFDCEDREVMAGLTSIGWLMVALSVFIVGIIMFFAG